MINWKKLSSRLALLGQIYLAITELGVTGCFLAYRIEMKQGGVISHNIKEDRNKAQHAKFEVKNGPVK